MQNAFLVRLSISQWNARKLDKAATQQAKASNGATDKAGVKVYKSLISAEALDKIAAIAGAARNEHKKRTVPWAYDGPGAITAEGYPAYKAAMVTHEKTFRQAVSEFYAVYDQEREAAREFLGGMFNESDYPASADLANRFAFSVSCEPMPEAKNFRVDGLAPELVKEIQKDIQDNNDKALGGANASAWARVIEHVERLRINLKEYNAGENKLFYNLWVKGIHSLIEIIPSINIANDPELARIGQKLTALTAYSADDLKESEPLRSDLIKQTSIILGQIDAAHKIAA
jgi:hypothetical protein